MRRELGLHTGLCDLLAASRLSISKAAGFAWLSAAVVSPAEVCASVAPRG